MADEGVRIDHIGFFEVGVPVDIGWAIAVAHANWTLTRTCKGCGVSATSPIDPKTLKVAQVAFTHRRSCEVVDRLGNNPVLS